MSRGVWVRFILVVGLLVGCVALAVNVKPNLGLDLRGGAQFIFEAEGTEQTPASAENVDKTLEVLRGRVDALGVAESTLARQGENRILVELPGVTNDEEAQEAEERIGSTAKLTIHEVIGTAEPDAEPAKKDNQVLPSDQGDTIEVGPTVIQGEEISGASAVQRDQSVEWVVAIDFNGKGGSTWADITGKAACNPSGDPKRRIAIVLDGEVISSPEVNTDVGCDVGIRGGSTDITGNFTSTEAKDLAALIEGGALPLELTAISDRLVGPSLGAAAIDASIEAGIIGIALTGLFIIFVYRLVGFAATHRAGVVRPARLRHARRARLDADAARTRGIRARDRHGDRRQRPRLRESQGGVRRLPLRGAQARARPSASTRRGARSSTPTSPPCSPPACCSSSAPARSRASVSRCPSVSSPRWSRR